MIDVGLGNNSGQRNNSKCMSAKRPRQVLHGRDEEIQTLLELGQKVCCHGAHATATVQICMVHGMSGSGKTSLCLQLEQSLDFLVSVPTTSRQQEEGCSSAHRPLFIKGKFDQYSFTTPYSAIVQAFDSLGKSLIQGKSLEEQELLRYQFQQVLTHEGSILVDLIPSFSNLLISSSGTSSSHTDQASGSSEEGKTERGVELASERLAVALRSFLRIACTPLQPIILFVDDLQWCDVNSLDILAAMVEGSAHIQNFLLLGGYRDEHAQDTKIRAFMSALQPRDGDGNRPELSNIALDNLNKTCVTSMVRDTLEDESDCASGSSSSMTSATSSSTTSCENEDNNNNILDHGPLSLLGEFVHEVTMGNPYFVLQFMAILKREDIVCRGAANKTKTSAFGCWQWDLNEIRAKMTLPPDLHDNSVAYFVTKRLLTLSPDVRRILTLAACLGYSINVDLLETLDGKEMEFHRQQQSSALSSSQRSLSASNTEGFIDYLESTQLLGNESKMEDHHYLFQGALFKAIAENLLDLSGSMCSFSHDRIQQCVYEMIPGEGDEDEGSSRMDLHKRTGRNLFDLYREGNNRDPQLLFLAVDQCNRGLTGELLSSSDRIELIRLNVEASQAARAKASSSLVALFLEKALALVQAEDWVDLYDLVLEVYSVSAEVESARGFFDKSDKRVETVLNHAKRPEDTVRAIAAKAKARGAQQDYKAALTELKRALLILGVKVPPSGSARLMVEVWKVERMLRSKTARDILDLSPMTDQRMLLAMRILQMGVIWGWNADVYFGLQCVIAMVRISMEHGRCYLSGYAFAGLGNILASLRNETKACFFGQVACASMRECKEAVPATTMLVHSYISHLRKPASASLEPLVSAYRVSLETGDLNMGGICICVYHWVYLFCGLPLGPFITDLRSYLAELKLCQQYFLLAFLLPNLHLALNLTGASEDPSIISWEEIEEADTFTYKTVLGGQHMEHPAELNRAYTQLLNDIVLGNVQHMEQTLQSILTRKKGYQRFDGSHISNVFFTFFDGLASFALLRRKWSLRYSRLANNAIRILGRMSKAGSTNSVPMLQLLQAEKASLQRPSSREADRFLYDEAISQLHHAGFVHFCAIANERAGEFMLLHNQQDWAEQYMNRAAISYSQWGATLKVKQLREKYLFVTVSEEEQYLDVDNAAHGKKRYSPLLDSVKHASSRQSSDELDGGASA